MMPGLLRAGLVQTASARLEGKVAFAKDHVTVDGKKVEWKQVLYLIPDDSGKGLPAANRLRLRNGETWLVEITKFADRKLTVRSELFGEKTFDLEGIAAIDFVPQPGSKAGREANTLYRNKGEAIPGTLLAIDAKTVKVDSVLGELNLPRETLLTYFIAEPLRSFDRGFDEVSLIDGTVLKGKLTLGDELSLEHALLGKLPLKTTAVRSIVRRPAGMVDLTELTPASLKTLPLLGTAQNQAARFQTIRGDGADRRQGLFVKGLLIEPKTVVRYKLPETKEKSVWLRARLLLVEGARGDVKLTVKAGSKKWEHELTEMKELSLELPSGVDMEMEIDFGESLRFPSGVILADPHLMLEKP